jgi:two-component system sensor histidine kinase AtoS
MSYLSKLSLANLNPRRNSKSIEIETLLNFIPHAAILIETQSGRITGVNYQAAELVGASPSELVNLKAEELLAGWNEQFPPRRLPLSPELPPSNPIWQSNLELIQRKGTRINIRLSQKELLPRNKHILVIFDTEDELKDSRYQIPQSIYFWDNLLSLAISTQKTSVEQAINQALQAGQALTEASILAIYYVNEQNPGLERYFGIGEANKLPERLSAQELTHLHVPLLWKPDARPLSSLHRTARSSGFSYLASSPLGQSSALIGLLVVADPTKQPTEQLLPLLQHVGSTVTGIIQNHARLSSMEETLQNQALDLAIASALEESVLEGLLVLTPDLMALKLNPAAEAMFGYSNEVAHGQPVKNILIGSETLLPALKEAQQGSGIYDLGNIRLYRRNGQAFLAHIRTLPILKNDSVGGIIVLIQDLSEQEEIKEHAQQLEQRALLGEFTAIFAHEVRNPINNISTGLQLMGMNFPENDPNQDAISRMQQDCDRLEDLMKSVLAISKPADYDMEILDLERVVRRLLERMHPRMVRLNVQYHIQVEPDCPPILGNLRALEQVFNNLISNAVQAMSENGGRLALKIHPLNTLQDFDPGLPSGEAPERKSYVEVTVADTGPGIPKELQDRIFQSFFTTNKEGYGLGLAIAKRIVTAHKGNLYVTSFPGGTVFHVQIPTAEETKDDETRIE